LAEPPPIPRGDPGPCQLPSEGVRRHRYPRDALTYLTHHVGNRLDRAEAEAFLDSAPAMLDLFEREGIAAFTLALTWAISRGANPCRGASQVAQFRA
jgi:hypothetical protein